jgi:hypothetical protein
VKLRVLVGCEFSGVVREAFRQRGHDAYSADILPAADGSRFHFQQDLRAGNGALLRQGWDLGIFHPPCTDIAISGAHRFEAKRDEQAAAIEFVEFLWDAPIDRIALENPIGVLSTRSKLWKATQIVQPYDFGHDASKSTCLWLKNLPRLQPTKYIAPRMVNGSPRWGNQTDSGQNRETPHPDRWKRRSVTYPGIADAMADQWLRWIEMVECAA